jgi:hypothetical protein
MSNHFLTSSGFILVFCALMVGLIVQVMPFAVGWRAPIGLYLLLPCGLIGAAMMFYASVTGKNGTWS